MSLTSPEDIENWFKGTQAYDAGDIETALRKFSQVTQNSRILFNAGCCYLTLNDIKIAAENYKNAVENDQHLAVGYFMLGLTSYLEKDFEKAATAFRRSLELLRGNRCVDYKQLGLKYQLYSCEILTNQAVIAYHLKDFDKAKELLLEAVGCKAEKRHGKIFDMLVSLQAGSEIAPFTLPKNQIFRPPKSYVQNLKTKDYLGKATVVTTANDDDIYACFSGIKDQVMAARSNEQAKVGNGEEKKPLSRALSRSKMLTELRKPERKATLKKTIVKRREPTIKLGKILEMSAESDALSIPKSKKPRPKSPCPPRKSSTIDMDIINNNRKDSTSSLSRLSPPNSCFSSQTSVQVTDSDESPYESISDSQSSLASSSRSLPNSAEVLQQRKSREERFSMPNLNPNQEQRLNISLLKPKKKQPALPGRASSLDDVALYHEHHPHHPQYSNTLPVTGNIENTLKSLSLQKPKKKPPSPLLEDLHEEQENQRRNSNSDASRRPKTNTAPVNGFREERLLSKSKEFPKKKGKKDRKIEVEVKYTFIKKLKIPVGCDLERIHDIVKSVRVPDQIELCYADSLGRQRTLDEEDLDGLLFHAPTPQKLLCFPEE